MSIKMLICQRFENIKTGDIFSDHNKNEAQRYNFKRDIQKQYQSSPWKHLKLLNYSPGTFLLAQMAKNLPAIWKTEVQCLVWEDLLEKGVATHSNTLAWRIPQIEEPGGLQSIGSQRIGHNWVTNTTCVLWLLVRVTILLFIHDSSFVNFLFTIFAPLFY